MNCIIIEDQAPAQRILKKYIEDIDSLSLLATFSNAIVAMDFLKSHHVDLIFLDIHLPKISGMDFLRSLSHSPYIILTTAFPDYALESYDFKVVDYLLKPIPFQRFVKAVSKVPVESKVTENHLPPTKTTRTSFFIKSGYEHVKVEVKSICYLKADADYTEIITSPKKYLSSDSLRHWLDQLDPEQFVQIHKSFIVNTAHIEKVVGNQVYLANTDILPIGRTYKEAFMKLILEK